MFKKLRLKKALKRNYGKAGKTYYKAFINMYNVKRKQGKI